jgi:DNA-binding Lrp family transcriptional regulator
MRLSEIDKKILEALQANPQGLPLGSIAQQLNRYPSQVHQRLERLKGADIILKIKSSVTIYKLSMKAQLKQIAYYEYACPKCGTTRWAEEDQQTLICANDQCLTRKGEPTRFWARKKPGRCTNIKVF